MRFVQIKSAEQQGILMLHRTRDLLMRQRTQLINALRAHMAELGIVAVQGTAGLKELLKIIAGERDARLPVDAHASLVVLAAGLHAVQTMIRIDRQADHCRTSLERGEQAAQEHPWDRPFGRIRHRRHRARSEGIPLGRDFAAWIGLVPREDSTGGKQKLGPISKQGDRYLRRILVVGAHAVLKLARRRPEKFHGSRNSWRDDPSRSRR